MSFPTAAGFMMSGGMMGKMNHARGDQVDEGQILWNNRVVSIFYFLDGAGKSLTWEKWREIRRKNGGTEFPVTF